jgi:uncharacterized protein YyaL (SSP411 family)
MSENRLKHETSPYLLQHKDNPVHWRPWGPEALAEAKRTNKPILLSVGYAACHWCHVMAHESFEDEATAEVMNGLFVNIKVDREERPDIDAIYMGALHRLGEQGGWPLTMFLDSDARPFWGGTYFPKDARYGRPAFVTVLMRIAEAYQNQPADVASNAEKILESLRESDAAPSGDMPGADAIADLAQKISRAVDPVHGGLNGAPKFPQWNVFWLLWRAAIAFDDAAAKRAVTTTLSNICQGGIYDHLGGGFARYSVDEYWLIPHFEKMLYDNALLIDLLTDVWRETQNPIYAARIAETVDWLKREMIAEGGGFAASLDADSEGEEGKFTVWTPAEIAEVLGAEDAEFFGRVYGVTPAGNFEGHTNLNRLDAMALLSDGEEARLAEMRCKLFARRASRIRPGWDDKVLADWNGLMIAALSRAGVVFDKPDWLAMSVAAFDAVVSRMSYGDDRLWHSYRAGKAKAPATASDYANMIWAALRLYQATADQRYLDQAQRWAATLDRHYWDETGGGYFTSADDTSDVVVRLKSARDDATPSANAIHLSNLIALNALTGEPGYEERARRLFVTFGAAAASNPVAYCGLIAASLDRTSVLQIVAVDQQKRAMADAVNHVALPGALEFRLTDERAGGLTEDLQRKAGLTGGAKVYICRGPACEAPESELDRLVARLTNSRRLGARPV